ncbi:MAG: molybdopterin molybdenumtransferase MoeA [Anaerolineales bacterium]|nr:molybdopterin molybdenumtransferase MoeA [Anaerolineales bacterium]MBX3038288.1 molybdopterin molybdenumtransferase MoeA [Anaerolineales bacterium]
MPEFLTLLPPDEAREKLLSHLSTRIVDSESVSVDLSLGRVTAQDIFAPHPLPEFSRSTVDGYAVKSKDTFGATDSLPAYLNLIGEVPMGEEPSFEIESGQCALIHTGGMLPKNADAVVMLEYTQIAQKNEIEIFKSVADGENVIKIGEDVVQNQLVIPKGTLIRPAGIGGLMALGIMSLRVASLVKVGIISTGDEVIEPSQKPKMGQVRDINSYTLSALIHKSGGQAKRYGIISDRFEALKEAALKALSECDVVIITAGSSASTRDLTAEVINQLGSPGVLVHGINTRPGKPTILGVCNGKAVIGLPGNPVSALVNGYLFVVPVIEKLLGVLPKPKASVQAKLTVNLSSQAGREDWFPVKLIPSPPTPLPLGEGRRGEGYEAEPIFGKSNLIFSLASADGLLKIHADATGYSAGEIVEVMLI